MHFLATLSGNYTFQLGIQSKGKCLTFIIRLRIITILHILSLIATLSVFIISYRLPRELTFRVT